jgi:hypothetical protein
MLPVTIVTVRGTAACIAVAASAPSAPVAAIAKRPAIRS